MPLNIIKIYNNLLDIGAYDSYQRKESLMEIFDRDIRNNPSFTFRQKQITPTPEDGDIKLVTLFSHLTTVMTDKKTRRREFDLHRAVRLHWVRHHVDEKKKDNMLIFSLKERNRYRTYIYDIDEKYVIVLEPLRRVNEYYFLTAYHLRGKDSKRNKIVRMYKRRLDQIF